MKEQLLVEEYTPSEANIINESSNDGNVWLSGTFMQAEVPNRNGRTYPLNEISQAVKNAQGKIQESNGLFGELDHPQSLTINLDRISHVITEMNMNGSNVVGKAKLLNTPMGKIAKELVESGVNLGVSSRGAGNVNEDGSVSGYQFVTVDIVAQPSAPGAVPSAMYESLQGSENGREAIYLADQLREDPDAQKYFKEAIEQFLNEGLFKKNNK